MKAQKNKIVFVLVMVCVVLFLTIYGIMTFGKDKEPELDPERIPIPDLEENQVEYESKLRALEALKEEREVTAPPIYPDHMIDDKGYFNPDYMEYEKQRVIDSIYSGSKFDPAPVDVPEMEKVPQIKEMGDPISGEEKSGDLRTVSLQERVLSHQFFFSSNPELVQDVDSIGRRAPISAFVDGDQTISDGHRLSMRLAQDIHIGGGCVIQGTRIYGFVKVRPNRVMVEFSSIGGYPITLKGYDLQDGQEGVYVENRLWGEVKERGLDETLGEINLPGLPQVNGIKRIFQRKNRTVKVHIKDRYQIILKTKNHEEL
jgi:hypothetical protein